MCRRALGLTASLPAYLNACLPALDAVAAALRVATVGVLHSAARGRSVLSIGQLSQHQLPAPRCFVEAEGLATGRLGLSMGIEMDISTRQSECFAGDVVGGTVTVNVTAVS